MVARLTISFDYKKATQALNYFALKDGGKINKMKALKLLFLADRYHLRKYGRLIANDTYFAMAHGPVASKTRDIVEQSDFIDDTEKNYALKYLSVKEQYDIVSSKPLDNKVFSDSDIEALHFAWTHFGKLDQFELALLTHYYPEWIKHEGKLQRNPRTRIQMDLNDFFDDSDADINKCFDLSDEDRDLRRKYFEEMVHLESIWR